MVEEIVEFPTQLEDLTFRDVRVLLDGEARTPVLRTGQRSAAGSPLCAEGIVREGGRVKPKMLGVAGSARVQDVNRGDYVWAIGTRIE